MKFTKSFIGLIFLTLFIRCSDDSEEIVEEIVEEIECFPEATSFSLGKTWIYSQEVLEVMVVDFCKESLESITFNGIEGLLRAGASEKAIYFSLPFIEEDSVEVLINYDGKQIQFESKIAIYPSTGKWTSKAPLISSGGSLIMSFANNEKAYLLGGNRYIGYIDEQYQYENNKSLVEYDPSTDSWKFIADHEYLSEVRYGFLIENKLYYLTTNDSIPGFYEYDLSNNSFELKRGLGGIISGLGLSIKNEGYVIRKSQAELEVFYYNSQSDDWEESVSIVENGRVNFVFEHDDFGFIGTKEIRSDIVNLWKFDPVENTLQKMDSTEVEAKYDGLRHLFVIDDISYFYAIGEAQILSPTQTVVSYPNNVLYGYNIKQKEWFELRDNNPEPFFLGNSFTINNRGFTGLNVFAKPPLFDYSTKIWEFIPE